VTNGRPRVAVVSACRDELNTNRDLRKHLAEGFATVCGAENTIDVSEASAKRSIPEHEPDLIVVFGTIMPDDVDLRAFRRIADACGAHLCVWVHDDPYELDSGYRAVPIADTIFTNDSGAVDYYRHDACFHLPLAASPTAHLREIADRFVCDVFFCGYGYPNRIALFDDLRRELGAFRTLILGDAWPANDSLFSNKRISKELLADLYAQSVCTVSIGRDYDIGNSRYELAASTPGPRTFEAAMAGCAQLHFVTGFEICDYFAPDSEILLFDTPAQFVEHVRTLVENPERLASIRRAAQARALRDHTYANRAATILEKTLRVAARP
jgi:spore maturation protein CgeB